MTLDQIDIKIGIVTRQTDYSKEEALTKLEEFGYDEVLTIKDFLGISNKDTNKVKSMSINQTIYKQLRGHLDTSIRDYKERVERGEVSKVV